VIEYTPQQQAVANSPWLRRLCWWIPTWRVPRCEVTSRPLDTTEVTASVPVEWPAELADVALECDIGTDLIAGVTLPGMPMQPAGPKPIPVVVNDTYTGTVYRTEAPIPKDVWVEGMPLIGGTYDRHWIGVGPEFVDEIIQLNPHTNWCLRWGRWDWDGNLVAGTPVTASGAALHRLTYRVGDEPHRLAIGLDDYAGVDGTKTWPFPRCGQVGRLSRAAYQREIAVAKTPEARSVLTSLHRHGAKFHDRTGAKRPAAGLLLTGGAQAAGRPLAGLTGRIHMRDFELVTK